MRRHSSRDPSGTPDWPDRAAPVDALLVRLADGRPCTADALALAEGVDGETLDARLAEIERRGIGILRDGATVRVARPLDLLDADDLVGRIRASAAARIERLDLHMSLDSTNRRLLEREAPAPGRASVCIAEYQHAGRGRRGRRWIVPPGAGLCLSVGGRIAAPAAALSALALAAGIAARRAIRESCGVDVALKWPNDLVWDGRKLGGILVEHVPGAGGSTAVVGVGINVALPPGSGAALSDWPGGATDLASVLGGTVPSRTGLAAALIAEVVELLGAYAATGLEPYRRELADADWLRGRPVLVTDGRRELGGVAAGIDADGALLLEEAAGGRRRVIAGDVTVRPAA